MSSLLSCCWQDVNNCSRCDVSFIFRWYCYYQTKVFYNYVSDLLHNTMNSFWRRLIRSTLISHGYNKDHLAAGNFHTCGHVWNVIIITTSDPTRSQAICSYHIPKWFKPDLSLVAKQMMSTRHAWHHANGYVITHCSCACMHEFLGWAWHCSVYLKHCCSLCEAAVETKVWSSHQQICIYASIERCMGVRKLFVFHCLLLHA